MKPQYRSLHFLSGPGSLHLVKLRSEFLLDAPRAHSAFTIRGLQGPCQPTPGTRGQLQDRSPMSSPARTAAIGIAAPCRLLPDFRRSTAAAQGRWDPLTQAIRVPLRRRPAGFPRAARRHANRSGPLGWGGAPALVGPPGAA